MAYKRIIFTKDSTSLLSHARNDLTIRRANGQTVRGGESGEYVLESPSGLERQAIDKLVNLFDCEA